MAGAAFVLVASVLAVLFVLGAHHSSRLIRSPEDRSIPRRVGPPAEPVAGGEAPPEPIDLSPGMLFANVVLSHGLLGALLVAAVVVFEVPLGALGVSARPPAGGPPAVAIGLAFGLALWVGNEAVAAVADVAGVSYDETLRSMLAPESAVGWVVLLGLVLPLVAGVEELLFRGALVGVPAAAFGASPWLLAVVSSAVFALGHGAQGRAGVAVTGLLGFALAAGYLLTGSLLVAVLAHYVVNAAEFAVHEGLDLGRLP